MNVLSKIIHCKQQQLPLLAVLVDPDKEDLYPSVLPNLKHADLIFVGGSTGNNVGTCIQQIRMYTTVPVVLFPGNIRQFSPAADALLFLTLLNAQTANILIQPHIQIAQQVIQSGIESIPMGYILIDGGRKTSVEIATKCEPIPQSDIQRILSTALAGQLLGKRLIYIEAGSGAKTPVAEQIIRAVRQHLQIPLIVGGGITTPQAMLQAFQAGADIVVIGNYFENHPDEIENFVRVKQEFYGK